MIFFAACIIYPDRHSSVWQSGCNHHFPEDHGWNHRMWCVPSDHLICWTGRSHQTSSSPSLFCILLKTITVLWICPPGRGDGLITDVYYVDAPFQDCEPYPPIGFMSAKKFVPTSCSKANHWYYACANTLKVWWNCDIELQILSSLTICSVHDSIIPVVPGAVCRCVCMSGSKHRTTGEARKVRMAESRRTTQTESM